MRLLLTVAAALACASGAHAQLNMGYSPLGRQAQGYGSRPNLSPYLNLLRGGSQAANYFIGVRPEMQRRQQALQFGLQIDDLNARTAGRPEEFPPPPDKVTSGTYSYLANTGPYFNNTGAFFPTPGRPINSLQRPPATQQRPTGRRGPSGGSAPNPPSGF
jgi:hypothetical protein